MAASYKDLINFEGSSAPLVQGRVQEGGRETDPWADQNSLQVGTGCCSPTVSRLKWNHCCEWQSGQLKPASLGLLLCCQHSPHFTPLGRWIYMSGQKEDPEREHICVCIFLTVPTKKQALGIRIQLHLKLTPAGKKRSNICHRNGFKQFGSRVCVQYIREKALKYDSFVGFHFA